VAHLDVRVRVRVRTCVRVRVRVRTSVRVRIRVRIRIRVRVRFIAIRRSCAPFVIAIHQAIGVVVFAVGALSSAVAFVVIPDNCIIRIVVWGCHARILRIANVAISAGRKLFTGATEGRKHKQKLSHAASN